MKDEPTPGLVSTRLRPQQRWLAELLSASYGLSESPVDGGGPWGPEERGKWPAPLTTAWIGRNGRPAAGVCTTHGEDCAGAGPGNRLLSGEMPFAGTRPRLVSFGGQLRGNLCLDTDNDEHMDLLTQGVHWDVGKSSDRPSCCFIPVNALC